MANENLGQCDCPVCNMSGAYVRKTSKGKAYILCEECGCQIFARSPISDKKIRERAGITDAPPPQKPAAPAAPVVNAIIHDQDGIRQVQTEAKTPPPPPANEETTIFDVLLNLGRGSK